MTKSLKDERLVGEMARFRLAFGCERCAHLDVARGRCSLEYPNSMHLESAAATSDSITFCKEFELG